MDKNDVSTAHDRHLKLLAQFAVHSGSDIKAGQDVFLSGPLEARPLMIEIVKECYKAGCRYVSHNYSDAEFNELRVNYSNTEFHNYHPNWFYDGLSRAYETGTARIAITGEAPLDFSPELLGAVAQINRSRSVAYKPAGQKISDNKTNWCIVPYPTKNWARRVYPEKDDLGAVEALWGHFIDILSLDDDDPLATWRAHNSALETRRDTLQRMSLEELLFESESTKLRVGLVTEHKWCGGRTKFPNGSFGNTNIPSFEVFTCPDALRVDGHVKFTKPISLSGRTLTDVTAIFESGALLDLRSDQDGIGLLRSLTKTDEGAARLGEVALVPNSSPISATKRIFYNTLFDENASSHIAFGQSFRRSYVSSSESQTVPGANQSTIHQDCMIGSSDMTVTGIGKNGTEFQIMKDGEFVI